jgi:autotransporter-associated beta strand protein
MNRGNRIHVSETQTIPPSRAFKAVGLSALISCTFGASQLGAQTYQSWRSENTQSSWQDSNAWWNFPNPSPIVFGQQEWDNNVQATQTSSADVSTWRFLFKAGASSVHSFSGNQISFFDYSGQDPMIINESSATHVINNNIVGDNAGVDPLIVEIKSSGGLTFGGTINNNGNVLNVQGNTGSATTVTFNGSISGSGGFYKDNTNITAVFGASNSYSGQTTINAGTLRVNSGATLGSGDVRIASGGNLELNGSSTVASVAELGTGNSGTISLGTGTTLTINGANKGALYQNSISGSGNLTMAGSGTTSLGLFGTQSYTGTTTVSGGKLSSGVTMATSAVVVNGGRFEMTADNKLADTATLSISSGFLDLLGTDTVKSLTSTGGSITLGSGKTLTVTDSSNIGTGSTITGGTLRATGGTLAVNSAAGNTTAVTIESGAKLTGTGKIGGTVAINTSGTLAPTAQAGGNKMTFDSTVAFGAGSIFQWDLNAATSDPGANASNAGTYGQVAATGAASGTAVFEIVLGSNSFSDAFWNTDKSWNNIFAASGLAALNTLFTTFSGTGLTPSGTGATAIATATGEGHFSFSGTTLQWTAVPEPTSALAGLLLGAGLIRRRRA